MDVSFEDNGGLAIASFVRRYEWFFEHWQSEEILNAPNVESKLRRVFEYSTLHENRSFYPGSA